ncbi:MAG: malto-oligosyltrehalose trehalohydrolase [Candidatus Riflebacteria bacterium]|nr:malto-oligosyltrehalose trehalohydrolase [Candidatus Riflebacteria bacterium]
MGAWPVDGGFSFRVFAPGARRVELVLEGPERSGTVPLEREKSGYHRGVVPGLKTGALYRYRIDGQGPYPDPASRAQPLGVHGPSATDDPGAFLWRASNPPGLSLDHLVLYELHVGAFTREGTFRGVIRRLDHLAGLGVTAVELMPVASFPGRRNWGYDGVGLYAPSSVYGGPQGLRELVDAAHARGLAVILDVVYNHFGPDGAYVWCLAPDFFDRDLKTPWGNAIRFSGPGSRPVRDFFVHNALHWLHDYRVDGLRLDATHSIIDRSKRHILREIADRVRSTLPAGRSVLMIAEDSSNDEKLVRPRRRGGYGLDAVWADDLHHQIRVALAGDRDGYYIDYSGTVTDIARTLRRGWFYEGQRSTHSRGPRGTSPAALPLAAFVHCLQNHDQVGNRALGERIHHEIPLEAWRSAVCLLLTGPSTPLLFMGQEWAASSPFLYFTDHGPELGKAVTAGRRREFESFESFSDPLARERIPDPQANATFERSKLRWSERSGPPHAAVLRLHRDLLRLRQQHPALGEATRRGFRVAPAGSHGLVMRRRVGESELLVVINLRDRLELALRRPASVKGGPPRSWRELLLTESRRYGGDPRRVVLRRERRGGIVAIAIDGPGAIVLESA